MVTVLINLSKLIWAINSTILGLILFAGMMFVLVGVTQELKEKKENDKR